MREMHARWIQFRFPVACNPERQPRGSTRALPAQRLMFSWELPDEVLVDRFSTAFHDRRESRPGPTSYVPIKLVGRRPRTECSTGRYWNPRPATAPASPASARDVKAPTYRL